MATDGSPGKIGNTQVMISVAAQPHRRAGVEVESVSMAQYDVQPCNGCETCYRKTWQCPIKDGAIRLLKRMAKADGMTAGSPPYYGGVTAQLKALTDISIIPYQKREFRDKVEGALGVGGGSTAARS